MKRREFILASGPAVLALGCASQSTAKKSANSKSQTEKSMFKVMFMVHKKPEMSFDEYANYSKNVHAPIVKELPKLRRYEGNYPLPDPEGNPPAFDGVISLWFDSPEDFQAALGSEQGQKALSDQPNFLATDKTKMLAVEEITFL
jgi:uncharacterized protein (TIGR02118 family)